MEKIKISCTVNQRMEIVNDCILGGFCDYDYDTDCVDCCFNKDNIDFEIREGGENNHA